MSSSIPPLDRIDIGLVRSLQNDARRSNKELAAEVGLAPSSTHGRLKRLAATGVLRGTSVAIDPAAIGIGLQAMVSLRLQNHERNSVALLWARIRELPEVTAAWYIGGDDDILLHVAVRDTAHLRDLVMDKLPGLSDVGRMRTELIFDHFERPLPIYADDEVAS
jgi:DNA-binding Lrp family transcriptional regulator